MTAPRLLVDLDRIEGNAAKLVGRLGGQGIGVTGITKATLGSPAVAGALRRGGVRALGDARVENVERLRASGIDTPVVLVRTPMLSQVDRVVQLADASCNTELVVLEALSAAAHRRRSTHDVILMVELGDLREGVAVADVPAAVAAVRGLPGVRLVGLGANLACQSGVVPDADNMGVLCELADDVESTFGIDLDLVSGGNSANLGWALSGADTGRVNDLRLGEAILLGRDPVDGAPIDGLAQDAITLVAEVIEVKVKPTRSWGSVGRSTFADRPARRPTGTVRQALLAIGQQDVDPTGLQAPEGYTVLGASSDHLVVDVGDEAVAVGQELVFGVDYRALVRAMTSPFVAQVHHGGREPA